MKAAGVAAKHPLAHTSAFFQWTNSLVRTRIYIYIGIRGNNHLNVYVDRTLLLMIGFRVVYDSGWGGRGVRMKGRNYRGAARSAR